MLHYHSFLCCMTTKSGVKLISILTIAVCVLYLTALGLYGSLYGLHATIDSKILSYEDQHVDLETFEGITYAFIAYFPKAMRTY